MNLTISKLAKSAGMGVETVRYYQRRGLMPAPPKGAGATTYREYGPEHVQRLTFIRRAQSAGFTLKEIGELLALDRGADRARVRALARGRLDALEARVRELDEARTALNRLLATCSASHTGPCPIIEAFDPTA
jgi:MerR family transcriptional regulator, mercuric resistance operon regulatory protein